MVTGTAERQIGSIAVLSNSYKEFDLCHLRILLAFRLVVISWAFKCHIAGPAVLPQHHIPSLSIAMVTASFAHLVLSWR